MKDELARFAVDRLRQHGFVGRGGTLRVVGSDLQWVARVERVGHVDQVIVELGLVLTPSPPAGRDDCRVLWSLAALVGGSDEVARALVPIGDQTLAARAAVVGDALDRAAAVVQAHLSRTEVAAAWRAGRLPGAFVFPDARDVLQSS